MKFSTSSHNKTFHGNCASSEPDLGFPLITEASDNLVVKGAEELSQQEGIVNAQHNRSDQFSDGPSTSAAESYSVPPSESQMLATIHSAYSMGTGKALTHLEMEQVIKVGDSALVLDNFSELFAINSASWLLNESQRRHALGIPLPDFESNKAACVAYSKALEFGFGSKNNDNAPLYLLSRRVMQI